MARTYNESKAVFLAGPIEWWWDCPQEPNRFLSSPARIYRHHRDQLRDFFVERGFLVYMPHQAFKGDWNEKMQPVNDYVLGLCDIIVDMTPTDIPGIVANGTKHEVELAHKLNKLVLTIPPGIDRKVLEMILETERLKNGW